MTNIVRNATRVLRGLFILRLLTVLLGIIVYTVRWSVFPTPEPFEASPHLALILAPTALAMLFSF